MLAEQLALTKLPGFLFPYLPFRPAEPLAYTQGSAGKKFAE